MDEAIREDEELVQIIEDGSILVIILNRPRAANALNSMMLDLLARALYDARDDRYRAVVLAGNGRNFCAGSDLKAAVADPVSMDLRAQFHPAILALSALKKPVVAAINGAAAGGGLSLALAADLRVMGQTGQLVPSWLPLGLVPDLGASWYLARQLGTAAALQWLLEGKPMSSREALAAGLVSQVVAEGTERAEAIALAKRMAAIPGPAVALTRQLIAKATTHSLPEQLEAEAISQLEAMSAPDQIAALSARVAELGSRRR